MKAMTLWQPYASAVAFNSKRNETRSWATKHRGPIAIHAGKKRNAPELVEADYTWAWCGALWLANATGRKFADVLPFGAIVAVCNLVDCVPTDSFVSRELDRPRRPERVMPGRYTWTERDLGNFAPGRFVWVFEDIRALKKPIPYRGGQRVFNIPDSVVSERVK